MGMRDFTTTNWSLVLAVRTTHAARRREALAGLCEAYWYPVYAFVRRRGHSAEDAADLTQAFFAHVLEKGSFDAVDPGLGRFRTFLLASVKHFLANEWDRGAARKRGGGWTRIPCEPGELEQRYAAIRSQGLDPEEEYERQWAATVMSRALAALGAQQKSAGRGRELEVLSPFLTSDAGGERPYREIAAQLSTSETAVRTAVHRLRQRLGAVLRAEIADTLDDPSGTDAELRHVLTLLADR
jgi:RNA polymerase sigma-70 factor (ECF subfamily)